MGFEQSIAITADQFPTWEQISTRLKQQGIQPVLRMIDGLPAFPDEIPEPNWKELRIGIDGQMITVRKTATGLSCVSWGTPDPALKAVFDAVIVACQGGQV